MQLVTSKTVERIKAGDDHYFYTTREWKDIRPKILLRDNYCCQRCLMKYKAEVSPAVKRPRITKAVYVHHKVELKDDISKALDEDNLVSLCFSCHEVVHGRNKNLKNNFKKRLTEEKW